MHDAFRFKPILWHLVKLGVEVYMHIGNIKRRVVVTIGNLLKTLILEADGKYIWCIALWIRIRDKVNL